PGLVILRFGGVNRMGEASWEVYHVDEHGKPVLRNKDLPLDYAQGVAEDIARESAGDKSPLTSKDAPWRSQPVTEAQLKRCRWLRIPTANIRTKGEASDAMNAAEAMMTLNRIESERKEGRRLWERR